MNSDGGVSGAVYHFDEEKVYIDFLRSRNGSETGGPFCTGQFQINICLFVLKSFGPSTIFLFIDGI